MCKQVAEKKRLSNNTQKHGLPVSGLCVPLSLLQEINIKYFWVLRIKENQLAETKTT